MKVIKVQGRGRASAEPDQVTISFDLEAESQLYGQSVDDLNARVEYLRENIEAAGLERKNLKTSAFRVRSINKRAGKNYEFWGYAASHELQIQFPLEKTQLNRVLHLVAEGASNTDVTLAFSVKDKDGLRQRVLTQAVAQGKRNAETLAAASDVTLGELQQIDYGNIEIVFREMEVRSLCLEELQEEQSYCDIDAQDVRAEDSVTLIYEITG